MTGVIVWFTGLPSSGKSRLTRRVRAGLARECKTDGQVRDVPGADAVYEAPEFAEFIAKGGDDDAALSRIVQASVVPKHASRA